MHDKKFDPKDKTSDGCNNSMSCAVFMACVLLRLFDRSNVQPYSNIFQIFLQLFYKYFSDTQNSVAPP
jgi:hypothetical protein